METKSIFFKSDFNIILKSEAGWAVPFRLKFYTNVPARAHVASFDGTEYSGCHLIDADTLCIGIDNTGTDGKAILGLGKLLMAPEFYLDNDCYNDGICNEHLAPSPVIVTDEDGTQYEIVLDLNGSSTLQTIGTLPAYYQKGDKGDPGEGGITPLLDKGTAIATIGTGSGTRTLYAPDGGASDAADVTYNDSNVKAALDALNAKTFPLAVALTISPTSLKEKGSGSTAVSLSWTASIDGKSVEITSSKVNGESVSGTSYSDSTDDTKPYTVEVTAQGRTATATKSVTYVSPIYVLFSTASTASSITPAAADKQALATSLNINKSFTNGTGQQAYLWIVTPYAVTSVKENGMGLAIAGSATTVGDYKYWRSTDKLATGAWSLTIK